MADAAIFALREGIIYLEVEDGTSRLLDFGSRFYGLSVVATQMLRATLEFGPDAAAERLAQDYGVASERVHGDLTTFLASLERKQLICRKNDRRIAARGSIIWAVIVPMLWGVRLVPGQRAKTWLLLTLAYLNCQMLGWAYTVKAWRTGCPRRSTSVDDPTAVMREIDAAARSVAASHPLLPAECKERALTTWALARTAGLPAELVVGVHPFPLEGHCWCVYNGDIYSDDNERCSQFKPVWRCS